LDAATCFRENDNARRPQGTGLVRAMRNPVRAHRMGAPSAKVEGRRGRFGLLALPFALALTGCAATGDWVESHPRTSTFIAASLVASAALSLDSRGHGPIQHDITSQPVVCASGSCKSTSTTNS